MLVLSEQTSKKRLLRIRRLPYCPADALPRDRRLIERLPVLLKRLQVLLDGVILNVKLPNSTYRHCQPQLHEVRETVLRKPGEHLPHYAAFAPELSVAVDIGKESLYSVTLECVID